MTIATIEAFLFSALRISTPLMYVALCAVVSQQGGLLNMAAESMMLASALMGVIASALTQNLLVGILVGAACSVLITLFLCFATFVMKVDLYLMSIAMNTALMGGTIYVMWALTGSKANTAAYYASLQMPQIQIPILKDIPFLGAVLSGHNGFTYIGWLMIFAVWFLIFRTKLGLRIRSVGQNPQAAESVGINPRKIYTISFVIAGLIASFGGMFLSMGYQNMFIREMTGGKGFIGMAAATIANASPVAAALILAAGCPIAAPSANLSGKPSPTNAQDVAEDMDGKIAGILDGGRCGIGVESTVVDTTTPVPTILRPGGITREMLEERLGAVEIDPALNGDPALRP